MKKSLSFIIGALVAFGATAGNADTNWGTRSGSYADLSGAPATRTRENVNYEKYQTRTLTRTYETKDAADLYYTRPQNRSELYKQYEGAGSTSAMATKTTSRTSRSEKVVSKMKRKYYLAHPFFQPLGGMFGSITDISYNNVGYDVTLPSSPSGLFDAEGTSLSFNGLKGAWDASVITIKEDFSYGITDRVAILGMLQYDMAEYEFDWDGPSRSDKMDDSDINMFGLGAQWRFVDNPDWIATLSAYFQHQKDVANNYVLDLKGGYKVARSTIYGLLRGWYVDVDGDVYGHGVTGKDANGYDSSLILVQGDTDSVMYMEAGLGVFSVLNEDWTLNVEAIFGDYDWHNQGSIKGAIGWQPNDWFALNLYLKTAFFDSADGKDMDTYYWRAGTYLDNAMTMPATGLKYIGKTEIDNYSETSVGLQVIFQF